MLIRTHVPTSGSRRSCQIFSAGGAGTGASGVDQGGALQETLNTLNTLGPRGQDDWTPLKVDNWIGPKTTEAFGKVLQSEDADGITAAFGRGVGLL